MQGMFQELQKSIQEYCEINNEYIKIKLQEEKVKVSLIYYY